MRIALFSDIHGNIVGLEAMLARLDQFGGADVLFALGDFLAVGPGADDLMELLLRRNVRMIRGNWDEIFIDLPSYLERMPADNHAFVIENYEWLMHHVSRDTQRLIADLPLTDTLDLGHGRSLFVCHAAPDDPWSRACSVDVPTATLRSIYGSVPADIIAYGHYHAHHVIHLDQKLLINVASVGMKRGGQSALTLIDVHAEHWTIQQLQVPYDTDHLAHLMHARGVPQRSAR
ncbi:MAG: metallophosphoesterase family protein [Roseiflexaceae bacterium]